MSYVHGGVHYYECPTSIRKTATQNKYLSTVTHGNATLGANLAQKSVETLKQSIRGAPLDFKNNWREITKRRICQNIDFISIYVAILGEFHTERVSCILTIESGILKLQLVQCRSLYATPFTLPHTVMTNWPVAIEWLQIKVNYTQALRVLTQILVVAL